MTEMHWWGSVTIADLELQARAGTIAGSHSMPEAWAVTTADSKREVWAGTIADWKLAAEARLQPKMKLARILPVVRTRGNSSKGLAGDVHRRDVRPALIWRGRARSRRRRHVDRCEWSRLCRRSLRSGRGCDGGPGVRGRRSCRRGSGSDHIGWCGCDHRSELWHLLRRRLKTRAASAMPMLHSRQRRRRQRRNVLQARAAYRNVYRTGP